MELCAPASEALLCPGAQDPRRCARATRGSLIPALQSPPGGTFVVMEAAAWGRKASLPVLHPKPAVGGADARGRGGGLPSFPPVLRQASRSGGAPCRRRTGAGARQRRVRQPLRERGGASQGPRQRHLRGHAPARRQETLGHRRAPRVPVL